MHFYTFGWLFLLFKQNQIFLLIWMTRCYVYHLSTSSQQKWLWVTVGEMKPCNLPCLHEFPASIGSPVTADWCVAAQNSKKTHCKDGVACNSEIQAALGCIRGRLVKCSEEPASGCDELLSWLNRWLSSWQLSVLMFASSSAFDLQLWFSFQNWVFLLCLLCSFKFWFLCCLFFRVASLPLHSWGPLPMQRYKVGSCFKILIIKIKCRLCRKDDTV